MNKVNSKQFNESIHDLFQYSCWTLTRVTTSRCPCATARWRGMSSPRLVGLMRAPRVTSMSTMPRWPSLAAQCSSENPWSSLGRRRKRSVHLDWLFSVCVQLNVCGHHHDCFVRQSFPFQCVGSFIYLAKQVWTVNFEVYMFKTDSTKVTKGQLPWISVQDWPPSIRISMTTMQLCLRVSMLPVLVDGVGTLLHCTVFSLPSICCRL